MALTKNHVIESIQKTADLKKAESSRTIESLLELMKQILSSGEDLMLSGFGRFCVKEKTPRRGRNPQTGESMILDGRRVITFKCSNKLKDKLNSKKSHLKTRTKKL